MTLKGFAIFMVALGSILITATTILLHKSRKGVMINIPPERNSMWKISTSDTAPTTIEKVPGKLVHRVFAREMLPDLNGDLTRISPSVDTIVVDKEYKPGDTAYIAYTNKFYIVQE